MKFPEISHIQKKKKKKKKKEKEKKNRNLERRFRLTAPTLYIFIAGTCIRNLLFQFCHL